MTPAERAALADLAAGELRLMTRGAGKYPRVVYSRDRPPAGEHDGLTLLDLAKRGLARGNSDHDGFAITEQGRAAL